MENFLISARQQITSFVAGLQWIDIAAVVIGLLAAPWGRRVWLGVNFILMLFCQGILIVVRPELFESKVEGSFDVAHIQLTHALGIYMAALGLCYLLMRKSSDVTVETSLLWTLSLMLACLLMSAEYSLFTLKKKSKFSEQTLNSYAIVVGLWLLITLVYALKDSDWGGYAESHGRRNFHLRIDVCFMFFIGVMMYSLPGWFLKTMMHVSSPDNFHAMQTRSIGAVVIAFSILGSRATNFLREDDKQSYLLSRLVSDVGGLVLLAVYFLSDREKWLGSFSLREVVLQTAGSVLLIANAAAGCNLRSAQKNFLSAIKRLPEDVKDLVKMKRH